VIRVGAEGDQLGVEQQIDALLGQQFRIDETLQPEPVDERHEHVGDVDRRPFRIDRACALRRLDPIEHQLAPDVVVAMLERAQRWLVEGAGPEVDVERQLEGTTFIEWERLLQHMTERRGRMHVVGDPVEPLPDLVVGPLQRRPQDVVFGREVVGERAGRVAGLDRDLADGDVVDAGARDHPPRRFDQLLPSALMINDLWQLAPPLRLTPHRRSRHCYNTDIRNRSSQEITVLIELGRTSWV